MKTAHLFAGVGGGLLADLIIGHTPILAVENNEFCCKVLQERKQDGWFSELHIECADVREFDFKPYRERLDLLAAGFPCQDISAAGRGAGIDGERSGLVWEVFRAIDEIQPAIVFLENSPNIRTKGRERITAALVERGYSWRDGKIAASNVGAPHKRERWFCIAANDHGLRKLEQERSKQAFGRRNCHGIEVAADAMRNGLQISVQRGRLSQADSETIQAVARHTSTYHWSQINADVCGVVHGISNKSHRIKALGNAQVPLQAAAAFLILAGMA